MKETEMTDRRRMDDRWHLRKEIHIGHIISTMTLVAAAFAAWFNLDKRIDKEAIINQYQDKIFQEHLKSVDKTFTGLGEDVKKIRDLLIEEYKNRSK